MAAVSSKTWEIQTVHPWLMPKTKHPARWDAGARAGLMENKCPERITKVTHADRTFSGQSWKLKVCGRKNPVQSFHLCYSSTFPSRQPGGLHLYKAISTHLKSGKDSVLGCKRLIFQGSYSSLHIVLHPENWKEKKKHIICECEWKQEGEKSDFYSEKS